MKVNVIHIVAGIVLLVALHKKFWMSSVEPKIEPYHRWAYVIALAIAAYHISKFMKTLHHGAKGAPAPSWAWIYLFHAIFVAGAFGVIGWNLKIGRQVLQLLATAMIAYHAAILADIV
jgi:hypothetical protein